MSFRSRMLLKLSVRTNLRKLDRTVCHDSRLSYWKHRPCASNISLPSSMQKLLWTPDISFVNAKEVYLHSSPAPNVYLMLTKFGFVWKEYRMTVTGMSNRVIMENEARAVCKFGLTLSLLWGPFGLMLKNGCRLNVYLHFELYLWLVSLLHENFFKQFQTIFRQPFGI